MNVDDLRALYDYNAWANRRLLAALRLCRPHDLVRNLGTSHGSIEETLLHIVWSEWLWLRRWQGESPKRVLTLDEFRGLDAVEAFWNGVESERAAFVGRLTNERLATRSSYENLQGEKWEYSLAHMMQHVVNHSSYHRGQLVTLLRQIGHHPPATDFLVFLDELDAGRT